MKQWWQQLSERDQRVALVGGVVAVLLLFYALAWLPLSHAVGNQQTQVAQSRQLQRWMHATTRQIDTLRQQGFRAQVAHQPLLVAVHKQARPIKRFMTASAQGKRLVLHFSRVPFDALMNFLARLWKENGVVVTSLSLQHAKMPGAASGRVTVEQAHA